MKASSSARTSIATPQPYIVLVKSWSETTTPTHLINKPEQCASLLLQPSKNPFTRDVHGEGVTALADQIEGHANHGHSAVRTHGQDAFHAHRSVRLLQELHRLRLDGLKVSGVFWAAVYYILKSFVRLKVSSLFNNKESECYNIWNKVL